MSLQTVTDSLDAAIFSVYPSSYLG